MRTKSILLIAISMVSFLFSQGQEVTLDEILANYYKATGTETMNEWKSILITGKYINQSIEFPFKGYYKQPGKLRSETEIQGNKIISVFDGNQGWNVNPWSGSSDPQDMTADEIKGMKNQADIEGGLYKWKEKGHKAELLGKEDLDGSPVYKIKLTRADRDVETWFLDAETYIPLKVSSIIKVQANETKNDCYFTNYNNFHGVLMARTMTNKFNEQITSQFEITNVDINLPISDSLFLKPVKK
jgi:outer membrane lipoprotein-sorting protein